MSKTKWFDERGRRMDDRVGRQLVFFDNFAIYDLPRRSGYDVLGLFVVGGRPDAPVLRLKLRFSSESAAALLYAAKTAHDRLFNPPSGSIAPIPPSR